MKIEVRRNDGAFLKFENTWDGFKPQKAETQNCTTFSMINSTAFWLATLNLTKKKKRPQVSVKRSSVES